MIPVKGTMTQMPSNYIPPPFFSTFFFYPERIIPLSPQPTKRMPSVFSSMKNSAGHCEKWVWFEPNGTMLGEVHHPFQPILVVHWRYDLGFDPWPNGSGSKFHWAAGFGPFHLPIGQAIRWVPIFDHRPGRYGAPPWASAPRSGKRRASELGSGAAFWGTRFNPFQPSSTHFTPVPKAFGL